MGREPRVLKSTTNPLTLYGSFDEPGRLIGEMTSSVLTNGDVLIDIKLRKEFNHLAEYGEFIVEYRPFPFFESRRRPTLVENEDHIVRSVN